MGKKERKQQKIETSPRIGFQGNMEGLIDSSEEVDGIVPTLLRTVFLLSN